MKISIKIIQIHVFMNRRKDAPKNLELHSPHVKAHHLYMKDMSKKSIKTHFQTTSYLKGYVY
jgi:hypothetical protein